MKALCWYGKGDVRVESVKDPTIVDARDIILKITSTAICGSDLHLYSGLMPTMEKGDVLGHEPMGEVVEVGSAIRKFGIGDRVVVPFTISCGECFFCQKGMFCALRQIQSKCRSRTQSDGSFARRAVRLFPYAWRFRGWAGGISARPFRRRRADKNPVWFAG